MSDLKDILNINAEAMRVGRERCLTPMLSRVVGAAQRPNHTPTADAHYIGWS